MTGPLSPERIIAELGMQPHPEGGHYAETFRDAPQGGRGDRWTGP
jgi:predicted cupin superfamily sugar epimerase